MTPEPRKLIATFLVLTTILAACCYVPIVSARSLGAGGGMWVLCLMWSPGIAGLVTRLAWQRDLRGIGWRWGAWRYPAIGYLLPPSAALIVYALVWLTGFGDFTATRFTTAMARDFGAAARSLPIAVLIASTAGVATSTLFAMGEELGWRGVLVPELAKRVSFTKTALWSGAIWALFHYPAILLTDYHAATPLAFSLITFTVCVVAAGIILTWLRLRSGSVWPAVLFHASHNLFVQDVFDRLTVPKSATEYVTTEFGVGLMAVYAAVAWWLWRRRSEIEPSGMATPGV